MAQTAFVVRVPEAEELVGALRERFDASARLGVPAHITVLVPFMPPEQLSDLVRAQIAGAFSEVDSFTFVLQRVGRFPATAYLAPEPAEPFIALTRALIARFPEFLPYGGAHGGSVVPHLTVADGDPGKAALAERELKDLLELRAPIQSTCGSVALLENSTGRWEEIHAFALRRQEG
jgi:2'-5' RNA ligase